MFRLVESYGDDIVTLAGRSYPVPSLLEDNDGIRLFLVARNGGIRPAAWVSAHSQGASAVISEDGGLFCWMPVNRFLEGKLENLGLGTMQAPDEWEVSSKPLTYREMVAAPKLTLPSGFVHLHSHSEFSALDGLSRIQEMVAAVVKDNQPALAVTDHGNCASHPLLQAEAIKAGIRPIFGIEAYLVADRRDRDPQKRSDYYHLILLALNSVGLRNLWAASTEANREGFYYRPRMDWETLERYSEGILCSTACLRGPVAYWIVKEDENQARVNLGRLRAIYRDRLVLELHTCALPEQRIVNKALVAFGKEYGIPAIVVSDSHYPCLEDKEHHRTWMAIQTNTDAADGGELFAGEDTTYHLMSAVEVQKAINYLPADVVSEAMSNTVWVAEQCNAEVVGNSNPPLFSKQGGASRDVERLIDLCLSNWQRRVVGKEQPESVYRQRFEREMKLLIERGFCGYFLVVSDYVRWAKKQGILVGPGRGSGGGSLVAWLCDITGIDPIEHDLMFERFLTEGRTSLPDFDVDFPSSRVGEIQDYIRERWGEDSVVRVGTHIRLATKGVVRDLARALKSTIEIDYRDIETFTQFVEEVERGSAGLGLPWDDLWTEHAEELQKYRVKYPELFCQADMLVGRLRTFGKHAAGFVITPDGGSLAERLPLRSGALGKWDPVTEFDMVALDLLSYCKFDILTLDTLDKIQMTVDLIREQRGDVIDPYEWRNEYRDPQVWEEICDGHTLGIFQIETTAGTRMVRRFKPQSVLDLAAVITLVRPGPMRSGLTETYLRRREGLEEVTYLDPRLKEILSETFGCIIYQENVMAVCQTMGGYTLSEADVVRWILGKKKVEKVEAEGRRFVDRCIERDVSREVAQTLWDQMAEFARYCVAGDTRVSLAASGSYSDGTMSVEEMFHRLHTPLRSPVAGRTAAGHEFQGPCDVCGTTKSVLWIRGRCNACMQWRRKFLAPNRGLYALAVHADGRIRPSRILDVVENGIQQMWRVTLADGRSITATSNHRHLTERGFVRVDDLLIGDRLVVDGGYEPHRYIPGKYRTTVGGKQMVGAIAGHYGQGNWGYINGGHAQLENWTTTAPRFCEDCGHDGSNRRLERAHLDGDRTNNDPENLRMLCVSCHKRHDYRCNKRQRRWGKGHLASTVSVATIEPVDSAMTYDVVMEEPHNFIGNGIATSNSFNKTHAIAYAQIAVWCAWFKVHYPLQFLTAVLSVGTKDRVPTFVAEARRMGYSVLPPDINASGTGFSCDGLSVRYGLDSIKGVGPKHVQAIVEGQPYRSLEDFLKRQPANMGVTRLLASVGAFDSLPDATNRKSVEQQLEWLANGGPGICQHRDDTHLGPNGLPCRFDWDSELTPTGKRGQPLKRKPLPLRCSRACRQFVEGTFDKECEPYTEVEIRNREMELLGVHLSSTPFDRIHWAIKEGLITEKILTFEEVQVADPGEHIVAAVVTKVRSHKDKHDREMGFISLYAQDGDLDVTVFHRAWKEYKGELVVNRLCLAMVEKNDRGFILTDFKAI